MMGGRPFGLGACSKVLNPLSPNRSIHSYTMLTWPPTRSATSAAPRPPFSGLKVSSQLGASAIARMCAEKLDSR